MLLAFAVVGAPAFVLDDALAQASDGRIRLSASSGTLWRGAGLLVEREGGRYRPWIDIAWRVDFGELWRGRLGLALTIDGELATQLTVAPDGFGIDLPGASLPLAPLVRILPHPTARLGWNGRLHASGELVQLHLAHHLRGPAAARHRRPVAERPARCAAGTLSARRKHWRRWFATHPNGRREQPPNCPRRHQGANGRAQQGRNHPQRRTRFSASNQRDDIGYLEDYARGNTRY